MTDRPPVRMLARLPEGNLNGFALEVDRLVDRDGPAEPEGYALVRYVSPKLDVNRETGVTTAVIRITEIEPLIGGAVPTDYAHAGEALQAIRGDRTGEQRIPEDDAAGYARLVELRRQLGAYANEHSMTATALGRDVLESIPGAAAGWRDDPQIIAEYLRLRDELDEDALTKAQEEAGGNDEPAPDDSFGPGTVVTGASGAEYVVGERISPVPAATFTGPNDDD